jgi:hypothetical protein
MTDEQKKAISELRDSGHAVAIFNPRELDGVKPSKVEDAMISKGWEAVEYHSTNE